MATGPIGDDSRPERAPVEEVELDGEIVIYNPVDHRIHHLDRHGSIVWMLLDGEATVEELTHEIATAFNAPPAEVRTGIDALLEQLRAEGLLIGHPATPGAERSYDHLTDPPNP